MRCVRNGERFGRIDGWCRCCGGESENEGGYKGYKVYKKVVGSCQRSVVNVVNASLAMQELSLLRLWRRLVRGARGAEQRNEKRPLPDCTLLSVCEDGLGQSSWRSS